MVVSGQVKALDKAGNDEADHEADFGRRRVLVGVIDSSRHFAGYVNFGTPLCLGCIGSFLLSLVWL